MAVVVFVAVDFGCLYGYYHVQMRTEDKNGENKNTNFVAKIAIGNDKDNFAYLIIL